MSVAIGVPAVVVDDLAESRRQLDDSQALAHIGSWTWDRQDRHGQFLGRAVPDLRARAAVPPRRSRHVPRADPSRGPRCDALRGRPGVQDRCPVRGRAPPRRDERRRPLDRGSVRSLDVRRRGRPDGRHVPGHHGAQALRAGAARQLGRGPRVAGADRRGRGRGAPPRRARPPRRRAAAPRDVDDGAAGREGTPRVRRRSGRAGGPGRIGVRAPARPRGAP